MPLGRRQTWMALLEADLKERDLLKTGPLNQV
jgi:hypothetical protein